MANETLFLPLQRDVTIHGLLRKLYCLVISHFIGLQSHNWEEQWRRNVNTKNVRIKFWLSILWLKGIYKLCRTWLIIVSCVCTTSELGFISPTAIWAVFVSCNTARLRVYDSEGFIYKFLNRKRGEKRWWKLFYLSVIHPLCVNVIDVFNLIYNKTKKVVKFFINVALLGK